MGEADASKKFALKPTDFPNLVPKMLLKKVMLLNVEVQFFVINIMIKLIFASPASGKVDQIVRGEKRRILAVTISSDGKFTQFKNKVKDYAKLSREELKLTF